MMICAVRGHEAAPLFKPIRGLFGNRRRGFSREYGAEIVPSIRPGRGPGKPTKPYRAQPRKQREGLYCCSACRKRFTVMVGTVMEGSHISITKWMTGMFLLCSSKKPISSHQLHRMLKITYKTAWFLSHRIRYAMGPDKAVESVEGKRLT
jgi:transposase-like protein